MQRSLPGTGADSYKSGYNKKMEEVKGTLHHEFWKNPDGMNWGGRGGANETLQGHGVDIHAHLRDPTLTESTPHAGEHAGDAAGHSKAGTTGLLTKVTCCHDIWMSNQYGTPEWRPQIYQSLYKKDFSNK